MSAAALLARAVARTCEGTGFLVIANHGVAPGSPARYGPMSSTGMRP